MAKDTHRNDKTPQKERLKEETRRYNDRRKVQREGKNQTNLTGKKPYPSQ